MDDVVSESPSFHAVEHVGNCILAMAKQLGPTWVSDSNWSCRMENRLRLSPFQFVGTVLLGLAGFSGATVVASPPSRSSFSGWTWMSGSNTINQMGVYGTQGVASAGNIPGARVSAVSRVDGSGNFWLFGGYGDDSANAQGGDLNDLWKYSDGEWTWVSGSNLTEQAGNYGVRGIAASGNVPGARYQAVSWADGSGSLWIFGGFGIDATGTRGRLNDLWKYSDGEWTWMSGAQVGDRKGEYGSKGTAAAANVPGARVAASTWADSSGALWLFGGFGYDSNGTLGVLNDLWKYSGGEWTWTSGSKICNKFGKYGSQGTAGPDNVPGARSNSVTWTDVDGKLWLFGGQGNDSNGILCQQSGGALPCDLNDLWEYSAGEWTWMGGSKVIAEPGVYGTLRQASPRNIPGARESAISWTDAAGDFWLFGGFGFDSMSAGYGDLNDLWKFSGGQWTWMSGSNTADQMGHYGAKGTGSTGNVPGARDSSVGWVDTAGNLWLFGGGDYLSIADGGKFNDLWKYSVGKTHHPEVAPSDEE
jgi:N-acetylneuraminic acid mutarotase